MTMNNQDAAERGEHVRKLRTDPEYVDRCVRERMRARLKEGGDCYPYSPDNLAQALREMRDDKLLVLSNRLISERTMELGYDLRIIVQTYWKETAIHLSIKEVENALKD